MARRSKKRTAYPGVFGLTWQQIEDAAKSYPPLDRSLVPQHVWEQFGQSFSWGNPLPGVGYEKHGQGPPLAVLGHPLAARRFAVLYRLADLAAGIAWREWKRRVPRGKVRETAEAEHWPSRGDLRESCLARWGAWRGPTAAVTVKRYRDAFEPFGGPDEIDRLILDAVANPGKRLIF